MWYVWLVGGLIVSTFVFSLKGYLLYWLFNRWS